MIKPNIQLKEFYGHEQMPSIFVMMTKDMQVIWCPSGNELARIYKEDPDNFLSGPMETPVPQDLWDYISDMMDNW